ncbi:MAG: hypothetical protein BRC29_01295 [Nanohaloarchaea archaeon SW_7_43_1]|nr:MAG: hypothetical protein BRC29_01295 [Nanohaloarchaea archaeon SW_7_43_1]
MLDLKQLGTLLIGAFAVGGFAFGGMVNWSGISGGGQQPQGSGELDATMPEQNYQESPYKMNWREQRVLANKNDVVFVNAFYENEEQKEQLQKLQSLVQRFDKRVYVSVASSSSNSKIMIHYGIYEFPSAVVNGGSSISQPENVTVERISEAACDGFRNLGDQTSECL